MTSMLNLALHEPSDRFFAELNKAAVETRYQESEARFGEWLVTILGL